MSKHAAAAQEIRRVWLTGWTGSPMAAMPIQHDNLPFKQPDDAPWGRLSVLTGNTTATCLGAAVTRTPFILQLQVFVPEHKGTGPAKQAADSVGILDGTVHRASGLIVRFETASITPAGNQGGAAAFLVTLPGTYDADPQISA